MTRADELRAEARGLESLVATANARAGHAEREAGGDGMDDACATAYRRGVVAGYRLVVLLAAELALARRVRARDLDEAERRAA